MEANFLVSRVCSPGDATRASMLLAKWHLGSEPAGLSASKNPVTNASIKQSRPGAFIEDDVIIGNPARFFAGDDVSKVCDNVIDAESAARSQTVKGLARRIVAEHLVDRRQVHARAQHRLLVEFTRRQRHYENA